jgi:hypothetical protein|uniref:Uncharacterized protein n=1 Tax=Populus trichocarpa TaxID=3694 RepID=U5GN92_POPTR
MKTHIILNIFYRSSEYISDSESKFTFASLTLMLTTQTKEESQLRSENHNDDNQPFQPRFEDFFVRVVQDKIKF